VIENIGGLARDARIQSSVTIYFRMTTGELKSM
jgi:hypothetical protein